MRRVLFIPTALLALLLFGAVCPVPAQVDEAVETGEAAMGEAAAIAESAMAFPTWLSAPCWMMTAARTAGPCGCSS